MITNDCVNNIFMKTFPSIFSIFSTLMHALFYFHWDQLHAMSNLLTIDLINFFDVYAFKTRPCAQVYTARCSRDFGLRDFTDFTERFYGRVLKKVAALKV